MAELDFTAIVRGRWRRNLTWRAFDGSFATLQSTSNLVDVSVRPRVAAGGGDGGGGSFSR